MPGAYSYDLRRKVIGAIDEGMGKTQASQIFKISRNTINLWMQRREETGDYRAKSGYQKGYGKKIPDLEKFREFALKNGSQTQREMAQAWEEKISDKTIGKALSEIGFTRKKKHTDIEKGTKRKERNLG